MKRMCLTLILTAALALIFTGCDPNEPTVLDVGDFHVGYLATTDEDGYLNFTIDFWGNLDFTALENNSFYCLFDTERDLVFDDGVDYYIRCIQNYAYVYKGYPYDTTTDTYKGFGTATISTTTDGVRYAFKVLKSTLEPVYDPDYTIHYWFESKTGSGTDKYDRLPNTGYLELDYTTIIY